MSAYFSETFGAVAFFRITGGVQFACLARVGMAFAESMPSRLRGRGDGIVDCDVAMAWASWDSGRLRDGKDRSMGIARKQAVLRDPPGRSRHQVMHEEATLECG
jgi:hypothetical protein